jgi:hypothetical protein
LFLWCSEDTRNWESIDIFAHHNRHVASADMFALDEVVDLEDKSKTLSTTTSYISLCRSASGDVLAAYDRLANGWKGAPGFYGQQDAVFCLNVTAS